MSFDADMQAHRAALADLARMTSRVLNGAFERAMAAEGSDLIPATQTFAELGRGLRLTLVLDLRLAAFARGGAQPARSEQPSRARRADRPRYERDREQERERDGCPMDPLGRVTALERVIDRHPDLDPDRRVTAQIIELKAFLGDRDPPPEPAPPAPSDPTASRPSGRPGLTRPPNRAERRRMRRGSG